MRAMRCLAVAALVAVSAQVAEASGHGPVFGAATPTLGRGAWSLDQAWTIRLGEDSRREQMLKTMVSFGITEVWQVSASVPEVMRADGLAPARMMSAMSNDREIEALAGWRFQRTPVGVGGRRESTLYVGGTIPLESARNGVPAGASLVASIATGYAGRAHYVWAGAGLQHYFNRDGGRPGDSRTVTAVYGYRPSVFRVDHGRPDLRFFIEATFEDRQADTVDGNDLARGARTVFVGPTSLLVYKAIALSGGVQWAAYQRDRDGPADRARIAVNFSYFWFR